MTDRELFVKIANREEITNEMVEKAQAKVEALDTRAANAKAKKADEHAEVDANVFAVLTAEPQTAADIKGLIVEDYHTSKIAASCKRLAEAGRVAIGEVTVNGRKVKSYAIAAVDAEAVED